MHSPGLPLVTHCSHGSSPKKEPFLRRRHGSHFEESKLAADAGMGIPWAVLVGWLGTAEVWKALAEVIVVVVVGFW